MTSSTSTAAIETLRSAFDGRIILPSDADYDSARIVRVLDSDDRRPAVIVRPSNAAEVAHVVTIAREAELPLAVRSGGHSFAGHGTCDDGIVLDLSGLRALDVDPAGRTAWAQPGLAAGEVTTAAGEYGLAIGFGDNGLVGIGGITLGGGAGFLARAYGLTIDNLIAAEIVTADGQILRTDADTHPDLFWAIRGGGGNFGVATRFHYRLREISQIVGGLLVLPATPETVEGFVSAAEAAPEKLTVICNVVPAPPVPFLSEEVHGRLSIMARMCWSGPVEQAEQAYAPFRALAEPLADMIQPMPYSGMFTDKEYRPAAEVGTMFLDQVDHGAAKLIVDRLESSDAVMRVIQLRPMGGAVNRVPVEATAYAHRRSRIMTNVNAFYTGPEDRPARKEWVTRMVADLRQQDAGSYVNFIPDEGPEAARAAYPGETWDRLTRIKARYDPTNLFRLNHNIPPAS